MVTSTHQVGMVKIRKLFEPPNLEPRLSMIHNLFSSGDSAALHGSNTQGYGLTHTKNSHRSMEAMFIVYGFTELFSVFLATRVPTSLEVTHIHGLGYTALFTELLRMSQRIACRKLNPKSFQEYFNNQANIIDLRLSHIP